MGILRCVFFYRVTGNSCRSGLERPAVLDRQILPVSTGSYSAQRLFDRDIKFVEVRLAKAALCHFQEFMVLQFLEVAANAALSCPHVFSEFDLAGKAGVICPGILEQHGVGELRTDGQILVRQHEVGDLSESEARRGVGSHDLNIARDFGKATGDRFHQLEVYRRYTATWLAGWGQVMAPVGRQ